MTSWFDRTRMRAAVLALVVSLSLPDAWASSLPPVSMQAVAGMWLLTLEGQGQRPDCHLRLSEDGAAASEPLGCETDVIAHQSISRWRSKPDGLALVSGEGRTLLFLSPVASGRYQGYNGQDQPVVLERATP